MYFIRTCGIDGVRVLEVAKAKFTDAEFEFVDMDMNKWGTYVFGVRVISFYEMLRKFEDGDKVVIPARYLGREILDELQIGKISGNLLLVCDGENIISLEKFYYLEYLEYHTNDHCNLNCRGCSHFCPLVKEEIFTDYELFERDIYRLKELIPYIKQIRIMGGEPFLNPQLGKFVSITRNKYKESDIRIVTNGILVENLSDELWEIIKENNVKIDISAYPALIKRIDYIVDEILKHGVKVGLIRNVSYFNQIMHEKRELPFDNTSNCICNNIHDGHIASCPMAFYGKYFNEYFHTNIPFESGQIDLFKIKSGKELMEKLNTPFAFCNYCNEHNVGINLSLNKKKWISQNGVTNFKISDWCEAGKI
ncbi:4Fe-4S single cluster protein [Kineothrix alysoides]|uniref:4Fe-4S single cluster protein n=1 Tax=Kineothrix alysoides TaxID=1469948 RepID=A0A4R1QYT1_9FIRM|nr:radical SAM protein [Kineothrix alysoides]TCL58123.1 4Fe-4S single cluster protein [Kineothrix alysoides]